jgi:hypothetical protein
VAERIIEGEAPEAILGYDLDVSGGRPHLAVATARADENERTSLALRVYAWDEAQRTLTQTATLTRPCEKWTCGSLQSCEDGCEDRERCFEADDTCVLRGEPDAACGASPIGCECRIDVRFQEDVSLDAADIDGDGLADLAAASASSLVVTTWYTSQAEGRSTYRGGGCRCGRYSTMPADIAFASFGGPDTPRAEGAMDLWLASSGGSYLVYGRRTAGLDAFQCGRGELVGQIIAARDIDRGRFACRPGRDARCPYEDVVIAAAPRGATGGLGGAGYVRVVFGAGRDVADDPSIFSTPLTHIDLLSVNVGSGSSRRRGPDIVEAADVNGDGHDDVVLFPDGSGGISLWLGRSNRGLGRGERVDVETCETSPDPEARCSVLDVLGLPDVDGDGRREMVVVCDASSQQSARLRWYASSPG